MRLKNISGKLVYKKVDKYRVDWAGKSRSKIQFRVKRFLYPFWKAHVVYEEFPVYGTLLKVDILNLTLKIAVEVDGKQHEEYNKFFHGNRIGYLKSFGRDQQKLEWLQSNGFTVINVKEDEMDDISVGYFKKKFGLVLV